MRAMSVMRVTGPLRGHLCDGRFGPACLCMPATTGNPAYARAFTPQAVAAASVTPYSVVVERRTVDNSDFLAIGSGESVEPNESIRISGSVGVLVRVIDVTIYNPDGSAWGSLDLSPNAAGNFWWDLHAPNLPGRYKITAKEQRKFFLVPVGSATSSIDLIVSPAAPARGEAAPGRFEFFGGASKFLKYTAYAAVAVGGAIVAVQLAKSLSRPKSERGPGRA